MANMLTSRVLFTHPAVTEQHDPWNPVCVQLQYAPCLFFFSSTMFLNLYLSAICCRAESVLCVFRAFSLITGAGCGRKQHYESGDIHPSQSGCCLTAEL